MNITKINLKGNEDKANNRMSSIMERLNKGYILNKHLLANEYSVDLEIIQDDIRKISIYLYEENEYREEDEIFINYDVKSKGYYLSKKPILK